MKNNSLYPELSAPEVPAANPLDGLLPISALHHPLQVNIRLRPGMSPGDLLELRLDGNMFGSRKSITMDDVLAQTATLWSHKFQSITEGVHH